MQRVISLFQGETYGERFPTVRTLRETNLFVETDCYCLQIPTVSDSHRNEEIDIFADTVLRLLCLGRHYSPEQIADLICVEPDFIRFILSRLREGGFLDDKNRPVKTREASTRNEKQPLGEITAYAFAVCENFLAYLHTEQFSWENATKRNQNMTIDIGTAGRTRSISGALVPLPQPFENVKPPRRDAFPRLIRNYNALCENYPRWNKIDYADGYMIDCSREQRVILHCKLALQAERVDYLLLSDGFGVHSEKLLDYVRKTRPEILQNFLSASVVHTDSANAPPSGRVATHERYGELYDCLESRVQYQGESMDEMEEAEQRNAKTIRRLCEAVEWALLYFVEQHPLSAPMLSLLRGQSDTENFSTLQTLSKKIGLRDVAHYPSLFGRLHRVRIERCLNRREPELGVLLPLAVVTASEDFTLSFHTLIREMPDVLPFLDGLRSQAAEARHKAGNPAAEARHEPGLESVAASGTPEERTRRFIELLLPDFRPNGGEVRALDGASQRRLNARVSVCDAIGWDLFQRLDAPLREELLMISPDKSPQELPSAGEFVFTLSRILEYVFRNAAGRPASLVSVKKENVLSDIQSAYGIRLSDAFKRVNPYYLESALRGGDATLNAYYLAFLFRNVRKDREAVRPFLEPDVSGMIEEISTLRGHTAQAALRADLKRLTELREQAFLTVKRLSEF